MNKQFINLRNIPLIKQRTQQWHDIRKEKITASNCATILELNPYKTKQEFIKNMKSSIICEPNEAMQWGIDNEQVAIQKYEKLYNTTVYEFGLIVHENIKWLGASPDGICSNGKMVEIKCPRWRKISNITPHYIWVQIQIQLEVCDLEECDLFEYTPTFNKCTLIKRNHEWFANVFPNLEIFYETFIQNKTSLKNKNKKIKRKLISSKNDENFKNKNKKRKCLKNKLKVYELRNFILNDPIIDYFNFYSNKNLKDKPNIYFDSLSNESVNMINDIIISIKKRKDTSYYEPYSIDDTLIHIISNDYDILINSQFDTGNVELLIKKNKLNTILNNIGYDIDFKNDENNEKDNYISVFITFATLNSHIKNNNYNIAKCIILGLGDKSILLGRKNTFKIIENKNKKIEKLIKNAKKWITNLKKNGQQWDVYYPQQSEMFPNMKNKNSYPWATLKKKIAIQNKEITLIWYMGLRERIVLHKKNIFTWDKINLKLIKTLNNEKKNIIKKIIYKNLEINPTLPKIKNNLKNIKNFFVDFETINNIYTNSKSTFEGMIKLIGVGHIVNGKWKYNCFIAPENTYKSERLLINEFYKYIKNTLNGNKKYKIYHWSNAEKIHFNKALKRNELLDTVYGHLKWCDLYEKCKNKHFVLKSAFDFSLKSIGNALMKDDESWENNGVDGMTSIYYLWNGIKEEEVVEYNEIDCKMLYHILQRL
jgi:putative phage-type endonuclease